MFNQNSKLVQDYVLLIRSGLKIFNDIPNFSNLKEVVYSVLAN